MTIDGLTIPCLFQARLAAAPEKVFLSFGERVWTYRQFGAEVAAASGVLRELGVGTGDRVILFLPNAPEFLFFWFALTFRWAFAVPINTTFRAAEVAYPLSHAEPFLIVAPEGLSEVLEAARAEAAVTCPVVWVGARGLPWDSSTLSWPDPLPTRPMDVSCLPESGVTKTNCVKKAMRKRGQHDGNTAIPGCSLEVPTGYLKGAAPKCPLRNVNIAAPLGTYSTSSGD